MNWQPVEPDEPIKEKPWFRWWYLLPVLGVVVAALVYFNDSDAPPQTQLEETRDTVVKTPEANPKVQAAPKPLRRTSLIIPYAGAKRIQQSNAKIPQLTLAENVGNVDISIPVAHSPATAGYLVQMVSPTKSRFTLARSARAAKSNPKVDIVRVAVARDWFEQNGRYTLNVKEVLKKKANRVEAESYRYEFEVKKK